ncbi:MAG: VTT domain-containing protein [Microlunatus sp.]|nr:VTT domain-containing protein [Microlunatus sp.]
MDHLRGHVLLFLAVTIGSAIPFVPTGEMVSGSSALAAHSRLDILLIFVVTWAASVLGDTLLLLQARLGARRLRRWLYRRKYADRVRQAERKLHKNAFSAIVTGRLVPGGRAPVIIALGLSRYRIRRFVGYDAVACGLWALIYSTIGSIGGRIANHPIWGIVIAIAFAVCMSIIVQQVIRLVTWFRTRNADEDTRRAELESTRRRDLITDLSYRPVRIDGRNLPQVPLSREPEMRTAPQHKHHLD